MSNDKAYYLALADGSSALPASYGLTVLCQRTRAMLRERFAHDIAPEPERELDAIPLSYLFRDHDQWKDAPEVAQRVLSMRTELLGQLSVSNTPRRERRRRSLAFILDNLDFFSGWELTQATSSQLQLDAARPWWKAGNVVTTNQERVEIGEDPEELKRAGFIQLSRDVYLERIRPPLVQMMATSDRVLESLCALLALYTASRRERNDMLQLTQQLGQTLHLEILTRLEQQSCAVPMKPLYSLPRETNNIASFLLARLEDLEVDEQTGVISGPFDKARVRVIEDDNGQQALFFDTDLVVKKSGGADTFVSLRMDGPQTNTLEALVRAIEHLDIDPNVLEHIPRVCAGLFSAAQRDRRLGFSWPGTFWDTASGSRLCRIIGFNPDNPRHRKRIQQARQVLETVILHREVKTLDNHGRKIDIEWAGPILEPRRARLTLKVSDREGFSARNTFQSWSIAKELWDMVVPEHEGGAPAFMVLDPRAFMLSERSSKPFNLYWTLVNRAYMGAYTHIAEDRVDESGRFSPRIGTLYTWAGFETTYRKASYLRDMLTDALDLMVHHGLLVDWSCDELQAGGISFEQLEQARVHITFSPRQLHALRRGLTHPDADTSLLESLERA